MHIELKYCSVWNYEPKAVSLAAKLLTELKQRLTHFTLIPAGGGCFEVSVDGDLIYSKLKTQTFPDEADILDEVTQRVKNPLKR